MSGICEYLKCKPIQDKELLDRFGVVGEQFLVKDYDCNLNKKIKPCLYVIVKKNGFGVADPQEMEDCGHYSSE